MRGRIARTAVMLAPQFLAAGIYRRLHHQAGNANGNASAARRTFAVRLHREGRSLNLIQELIGVSSLSAVKKMVESDPVRLASIVSGVI